MSFSKPSGLRCKYCRYTLISREEDFVGHDVAARVPIAFIHKDKSVPMMQTCSLYFVEDQRWVLEGIEDPESIKEGPINCPKCKHKVGGWSWVGIQCSCGSWVSPAFSFIKSKVDPINRLPPASIRQTSSSPSTQQP